MFITMEAERLMLPKYPYIACGTGSHIPTWEALIRQKLCLLLLSCFLEYFPLQAGLSFRSPITWGSRVEPICRSRWAAPSFLGKLEPKAILVPWLVWQAFLIIFGKFSLGIRRDPLHPDYALSVLESACQDSI